MFTRIIVPLDGSPEARRAVPIAAGLARECDAELELLHVLEPNGPEIHVEAEGEAELGALRVLRTLRPAEGSVAATIAEHFTSCVGAGLVMSSAGRGRSQAVFGSVAADVLAATFGPVIVVGPKASDEWRLERKQLVIPIDGSDLSEQACGLGIAMCIELGLEPWIVWVDDPMVQLPGDVLESSYPASVARKFEAMSGRTVEFDVLHDEVPADAITSFADRLGARLIVASTHGRTGFDRLRFGSVASDIVRHATCPVVLVKPPELATLPGSGAREHRDASTPAATHATTGAVAQEGRVGRGVTDHRHRRVLHDLEQAAVTLRAQTEPAFESMRRAGDLTMADGAVPGRIKEALALMIAVMHRCDGCIAQHARRAAWDGASKQEVAELLAVVWNLHPCAAASYAPRAWAAFLEFHEEAVQAGELVSSS